MDYQTNEAFKQICKDAVLNVGFYVSLMAEHPYYGGPEEGGWYGSDTEVIAFQEFPSEELADKACEAVQGLAKQMSADARRAYGGHCLRQTEWLDGRGLDDEFLRPDDGESRFFVTVTAGVPVGHRGERCYS